MCSVRLVKEPKEYYGTHKDCQVRSRSGNAVHLDVIPSQIVEGKAVRLEPGDVPNQRDPQLVDPRTSTPRIPHCGGGPQPPTRGHDGPISPIQVLKGDVHPTAAIDCPTAHDGLLLHNDVISTPPDNSDSYIHPANLAETRRMEWPSPAALGHKYPTLACLYTAVHKSGLPNAMESRVELPTNLNVEQWLNIATGHPDDNIVLDGIRYGFHSQYWGPPRPTHQPGYNHVSAQAYPRQVNEYVAKEISEGALIGPFHDPPFEWVHYSPLMTFPKQALTQTRGGS